MPKGDHFKKTEPRIHQISFKVSAKELEKIEALAQNKAMTIPEWIREQINVGSGGHKNKEIAESTTTPKKQIEEPIRNQMSLF
jgi:seryl-tRNA synthetase